MTLTRRAVIVFDASCLIAAAGSATGGSAFVLSLCARGYLVGAVSDEVLSETARNTGRKLDELSRQRLRRALAAADLLEAPSTLPTAHSHVNAKDRHLFDAALSVGASFVLTLDRRLITEVAQAPAGVPTLLPAEFIRQQLPTHPDFPFTHH